MKNKVISMIMTIVFAILMVVPTITSGFTSIDPTPSIDPSLKSRAEIILGAVQIAAVTIAIGMVIYIGIKYTMSSANERAEVKQSAINYVIGAIVIAVAPALFKKLYQFFIQAKGK